MLLVRQQRSSRGVSGVRGSSSRKVPGGRNGSSREGSGGSKRGLEDEGVIFQEGSWWKKWVFQGGFGVSLGLGTALSPSLEPFLIHFWIVRRNSVYITKVQLGL